MSDKEDFRSSFFEECEELLEQAQDGLDALHQQALAERLSNEIVGAHFEAEQLVDLVVLRG